MDAIPKSNLEILDYLNDSVLIVAQDASILATNNASCKHLGYSKEELVTKKLYDIVAPEFASFIQKYMNYCLHHGSALFESAHICKDGTVVPVELSVQTFNYDGSQVFIGIVRDITLRKQTEKALQESESRLRAITDNMSDTVWITDLEFNIVYISPSIERILGFSLEEYIKRKVEERYPPEVIQKMYPILTEELENDKKPGIDKNRTRIIEIQEYNKDGDLIDLSVHVKFLRDKEGNPTGIIGVSRDISKQKKAEKEIQRYKYIFEQSLNEIYLFDTQTFKFSHVNQVALDNLGYTLEELQKMTPLDIKPALTHNVFNRLIKPLKEGSRKKVVFETVHKRKDGSTYDVEVQLQMIQIQEEEILLAIIIDITERKKFEKALKESEEKFRILAESTSMGIMMYQDDKWIYANPAAEKITGYTSDELCTMNFWDVVHPNDREIVRERGQRRQSGKQTISSYEFRIVTKNGDERWIFLSGSTVLYNGRPAGIISVFDITDHKKDEQEKKKLQEQLLQSQKIEAIGTLAGGVAHDFNNMLNIIAGHAELALLNIPEDNPARIDIEEIKKAAKRSADVTKKLLTFARKHEEKESVVNLNQVIDSMIGMLTRLIGEHIHLIWEPIDKELSVKIDPASIDQILINLCVNARDAIKNHGTITIKTKTVSLDEEKAIAYGVTAGDFAVIEISDDGCGMDEDTISHIFDPFFTTKEVGKGTGLGLSTVYGLVKNNGGCIDVSSKKDIGTVFSIYLPLFIEKKDFAPIYDETIRKLYHGTETILLVEDEVSIMNMIKKMLEILGYTVLATDNPYEALEIAKKYVGTIHLLFTDVIMPKMNGKDLARLISAIHPQIKVIYSSGYPQDVLSQQAIQLDNNYLPKPILFASLATTVREVLGS